MDDMEMVDGLGENVCFLLAILLLSPLIIVCIIWEGQKKLVRFLGSER